MLLQHIHTSTIRYHTIITIIIDCIYIGIRYYISYIHNIRNADSY